MILIGSFILEGMLSSFNNIFHPLFVLSVLVTFKDKKKYIFFSFIVGIIYGIIFTNNFLLNSIVFYICSIFIKCFFSKTQYNFINIVIITVLNIIIYRVAIFTVLSMASQIDFNVFHLFESIYSSLISNIIFIIILYLISNKRIKKTHLHIIR